MVKCISHTLPEFCHQCAKNIIISCVNCIENWNASVNVKSNGHKLSFLIKWMNTIWRWTCVGYYKYIPYMYLLLDIDVVASLCVTSSRLVWWLCLGTFLLCFKLGQIEQLNRWVDCWVLIGQKLHLSHGPCVQTSERSQQHIEGLQQSDWSKIGCFPSKYDNCMWNW